MHQLVGCGNPAVAAYHESIETDAI